MGIINLLNVLTLSLGTPSSFENQSNVNLGNLDSSVVAKFNVGESDPINNLYNNYGDAFNSLKSFGKSDGDDNGYVSDKIEEKDLSSWLKRNYNNYNWLRENGKSNTTETTTSSKPIEMLSSDFSTSDLKAAINNAGLANVTSYGGCGPIAMLGIFDYFSRCLGYDELIPDVYNSSDRVALATEVLQNANIRQWQNSENQTISWPWYYADCLNHVIENHNLKNVLKFGLYINYGIFTDFFKNIIESNFSYLVNSIDFGFVGKEILWNKIVESIDNGLPVTLFNGTFAGDGDFAGHYVNVYGYDTWTGYGKNRETKTKRFLKARLNWGKKDEYYCDADFLDCASTGIFTYSISYEHEYSFESNDFSELVNDKGQGQYFFDIKDKKITFGNGISVQTQRKRASFIENEFLVLSPNRKNAGNAFIEIVFPHQISEISFTAAMWGATENNQSEIFMVESVKKVSYVEKKDYLSISALNLPNTKYSPRKFKFVFSKKCNGIRISANDKAPYGDRNKGRICLDNFNVKYN